MLLLEDRRFYTYIYLNPLKPGKYTYEGLDRSFLYEPFYVGKGKGKRMYSHIKWIDTYEKNNKHKINTIKKILKNGKHPIIFKLKENLTQTESCNLEKYYIKNIGRCDLKTGYLTNLTDGGDGVCGWIFTDERRLQIKKQLEKMGNPGSLRKGKTYEEVYGIEKAKQIREKQSIKRKQYKMPPMSQKQKDFLSNLWKGHKQSEESKNKKRKTMLNLYKERLNQVSKFYEKNILFYYIKGCSIINLSKKFNTSTKIIRNILSNNNFPISNSRNIILSYLLNNSIILSCLFSEYLIHKFLYYSKISYYMLSCPNLNLYEVLDLYYKGYCIKDIAIILKINENCLLNIVRGIGLYVGRSRKERKYFIYNSCQKEYYTNIVYFYIFYNGDFNDINRFVQK